MLVYYSLFAFTVLATLICTQTPACKTIETSYGTKENRIPFLTLFLVTVPSIFFLGMQDNFADTPGYISFYQELSTEFSLENLKLNSYGFSILQRFCKAYLFENANIWLILMIIISIIPIIINISKHSPNPAISFFLFFASTEFTFLINGARQFIAVCIAFYGLKFLINKQPIRYLLIVLLAMSFHQTALIMLIAYPISVIKPFKKNMILISILALVMAIFSENVLQIADDMFIADSAYGHYMDDIYREAGVNILRTLTHWVPVVLTYIYREKIWQINDRVMNICVNFSLINALIFTFASTIGANLTGRMAEYFTIYNLLLYPMIFKRCASPKTRQWLIPLFVIIYIAFFIYQMHIMWGTTYRSQLLGIFC